jgi:two-component system, OmpR family, response regulator
VKTPGAPPAASPAQRGARQDAERLEPKPFVPADGKMRKRVALVVDDNLPEREQIAGWLRLAGFQVEMAKDYLAAVKTLTTARPDIILCNLTLPRESGFDLVEHVRKTKGIEWIPILVMTDRYSPEDMAHAEELGANAFLKKPFQRDRLAKYVTTLLDGPHASRPSVRRLHRP